MIGPIYFWLLYNLAARAMFAPLYQMPKQEKKHDQQD
jgi:hypothetical protein